MTELDKPNIRLVTDAVTFGLRKLHPPKFAPMPEDDEGTAFDRQARDVLERFERAHDAIKAEESDR
jgi:hypothetical protein